MVNLLNVLPDEQKVLKMQDGGSVNNMTIKEILTDLLIVSLLGILTFLGLCI